MYRTVSLVNNGFFFSFLSSQLLNAPVYLIIHCRMVTGGILHLCSKVREVYERLLTTRRDTGIYKATYYLPQMKNVELFFHILKFSKVHLDCCLKWMIGRKAHQKGEAF